MNLFIILSCLVAILIGEQSATNLHGRNLENPRPCSLKVINDSEGSSVCVCNSNYCDELHFEWPTKPGEGRLIQTTKSGLRFDVQNLERISETHSNLTSHSNDADISIFVDSEVGHDQLMYGFGGAFTDAAGLNIQSLQESLRQKLIESYFGEHGSQYSIGRVVIGGSDFSTRPYSYDDVHPDTPDFNLTHWSLAYEDHNYKIPIIKEAKRLASLYNGTLKLFGSSWSPPAFMKTSKSLVRGHLIDKDHVYRSYAKYLVKFYKAYEKYGIPFWGGTVQNEPIAANSPSYKFNSLQMTSDEAVKFIANYLGPELVANGYTKDKFKLMINDDNTDTLAEQVPQILANEKVRKYVAGLAYHWYNREKVPYDLLDQCYEEVEQYVEFMLSTEASNGPGVDLGSWQRAEDYAQDIIESINHLSNGWVDWNLVVDEQGGPNWVKNSYDAPIVVSKDRTEFYKQPMYYVLAHFSRFFRPNFIRAFVRSDGSVSAAAVHDRHNDYSVLIFINRSEKNLTLETGILDYRYLLTAQAKSINTVVIKL